MNFIKIWFQTVQVLIQRENRTKYLYEYYADYKIEKDLLIIDCLKHFSFLHIYSLYD